MLTRSRVFLRRRAGLLLALAAVLLLGSWVSVEPRDDSWLLVLGGRPLDPMGKALSTWTRWRRDCQDVRDLSGGLSAPVDQSAHQSAHQSADQSAHQSADQSADQSNYQTALHALREFSPPDSASAAVLRMQALGPWRLVQAKFDRLEPVVVVVLQQSTGARVMDHAVWSGTTLPWDAGWRIRGFILSRAPEVPRRLIECLEPDPVFDQPPSARP